MRKSILLLLLLQMGPSANAQNQVSTDARDHGTFLNPVFAGDYPDPSILREGDEYYVVHSSFEYYPGLLIWRSRDLIHWTPVANALHRYVGSVWAPDLVKHGGRYHIYFPANGTNYVVTASSIAGPWSDPVDLKVGNIDPGHVVGADGARYLYFSSGGYVRLSEDGLSTAGELVHAYDGWEIPREWTIECFCMEGPKLLHRGGVYHLTVAEGGTSGPATGHMVVSARSASPTGPWENSPFNPILRTVSPSEKWLSVGHATPFEDASGKWWLIFHGYENWHYNMGRQTLLAPVEWTRDCWYRIPEEVRIDGPMKRPAPSVSEAAYSLSDPFDGPGLRPHWKFFAEYDTSRFRAGRDGLVIRGKGKTVGESSPLLCVPSSHSYVAGV